MPETPLDAATRAAVIGWLRAKRARVDAYSPSWHVINTMIDELDEPRKLRFNVPRGGPFGGSGATFQPADKGETPCSKPSS